jgi:competence protein ComEC
MDLLNLACVSALVILAVRPSEVTDASFLLSFSAIAAIGAVAVPCMARSSEPYRLALDHLSDVTRDVAHPPRVIQFRLEMRAAAAWIAARLPRFSPPTVAGLLIQPLRAALYFWEIAFLSAILQLGMLPPMAFYFHRVTLVGSLANIPALLLTGLAVPLGFITLGASLVSFRIATGMAKLLGIILSLLDASVRWLAG